MKGFLVTCLVALVSLPATAQHPVTFEHTIGFDGLLPKDGKTYPISLFLSNKGTPVTGVIELRRGGAGGSAAEVTRVFPFTLPAPSQKRFTLPAPYGAATVECVVRFDQDEIPDIRRTFSGKPVSKPLILAWGAPKAYGMEPWKDAFRVAAVKPSVFPEDPQLARGVHAIVASGLVLTSLPKETDQSLRRWLAFGGTLIIDNPPPTPGFRDWFKATTGFPFSQGPEGEMHITPVDFGRIVTRSGLYAAGKVEKDTLPYDLEWADPTDFASFTSSTVGQTGVFDSAWKTNRTYGSWTLLIVACIIVGYIAITGPLEYHLTVKKERYRLVWPIYLGSIVLFSFFAYSYSRVANLGEMRAVTAAVIDVSPLRGELRGSGIGWIYSSANRTYNLACTAPDTALQFRQSGLGQTSLARVSVVDGSASGATARIPIYSSKWFSGRWTAPTTARIVRPPATSETPHDRVEITLPKGLKIDAVWQVSESGLAKLSMAEAGGYLLPGGRSQGTQFQHLQGQLEQKHANSVDLPSPDYLVDMMTWITFGYRSEGSHFSSSPFNQRPSEFEADWVRPHPGKKSPPLILVSVRNPDAAEWVQFTDANPSLRSNILFRFPLPPPGARR